MALSTEDIWNNYSAPIQRFVRASVDSETLADDLVQDIFLKIHMHIADLHDEEKLRPWLFRIVRNTLNDYYRSRKMVETLPVSFDLPEEVVQEEIASSLLHCIADMVNQLPTHYRDALVLTEYQGLTQRELAERLHLSFSGAKSRVQRGRQMLKHQLLDCCHFVRDRRGSILSYHPRNECCVTPSCTALEYNPS